MEATCTHLARIHKVTPSGAGCKECLEMGDTWVQLRVVSDVRARGML